MGNSFGQIPTYSSRQAQHYVAALPSSLYLQMDLSDILVRATMAIANNGLDLTSQVQRVSFDGILQNYIDELSACESRQAHPLPLLDRLHLSISRLMLHAFQFFKTPAIKHLADWRSPFDAACTLIHQLNDLEKSMHIDLYGTFFVYHGALLAACIVLRCLKSPFVDTIGEYSSTAQALFFSAINMNRNISIVDGDKPAKSAWVLQQLWRSETVFKHHDGSWNLDIRVRSRFSSSVLYDTMWWGREELSGQPNAYPRKSAPRKPCPLFPVKGVKQHYVVIITIIKFITFIVDRRTDIIATALTPAWSNNEATPFNAMNNMFAPDLFADMAFTQDWILDDWEINPSKPAPILNPNPNPAALAERGPIALVYAPP
jgi:hypothetical protein